MTAPLTPWTARLLRRATRADAVYGACALAMAVLAVSSGRVAARHLSPVGAESSSRLLDDLELPSALPDAALTRDDGAAARLHALASEPRTIVSFYAPWCGPCQEELPALVTGTAEQPSRLVVVVGADEDAQDVRRKLDNLGFKSLRFHIDRDGQLQSAGRVTALPTTFLIGRAGRVIERVVGNSELRLQMLIFKALNEDAKSTFQ